MRSLYHLVAGLVLLSSLQIADAQEAWHRLEIPEAWRKVPGGDLKPVDGYSWYRALVKVPSEWKGDRLTLFAEALDDARISYVNGVRVGATGTFPPQFRSGLGEKGRYDIDGDLIVAGDFNTVAIRVFQNDPRPNFSVAPPVLLNESKNQAIRLEGHWQYRPGDDTAWSKATPNEFEVDASRPNAGEGARSKGVFARVDDVDDVDRYVMKRKGDNDPVSPSEAVKRFTVPDDLEIQLVVSEPEITQPLYLNFDNRGRLWVMEYRQYPDVAGVKMVSRDVFLRSVYDKVPLPPPHHVKGQDRISLHEDTDGDGVYDKHKVFVDGLNIASSFAFGRSGVFVTNPPYLLFYPDANGDDVPDSDPEVLLEGFGLEDSHSVVNSLRFGPDGWLYGAQGSTVTGNVKPYGSTDKPVLTQGQLIWRYHPELKRYEVFAEGGGNSFGCEIDEKGRVFSGHNGGDTRGFHYVQGGYYRKGFGKHGPLSNPYAFGYFENIKHHNVARFTHNFVIYEGNVLPDAYRGRLFGIEPLQGQVVMSSFEPFQSSFETNDLSRPIKTDDQWFRPVDIKVGPDGCIYIADLYEQRIDHSSHYAGRIDRASGRVYRLRPKGDALPKPQSFDYSKASGEELISVLGSSNKWHRQAAMRVFGDRKDASQVPALLSQLKRTGGNVALESLWALHLSGGLSDDVAEKLLGHSDPFVRAWTVRLLCDHYQVSPQIARALVALAAQEAYIDVRKQLASSARRLPAEDALPIIEQLLKYDEDAGDIHQPLLLWWAIEAKAGEMNRDLILDIVLKDPAVWQRPLAKDHVIGRLMRRYALAGSREELLAAARLLKASPDAATNSLLLQGFEDAYKGRSLAGIPQELVDAIAATGGGSTALRLRQGDATAVAAAVKAVADPKSKREDRLQFVEIFGEVRRSEFIPALLQVVSTEKGSDLVSAALTALQAFDDLRVGQEVVKSFGVIPGESKLAAETLLASRSVWAIELLKAVDAGSVKPDAVSENALRKFLLHDNAQIRDLVAKHWGSIAGASTEQMKDEIARLTALLAAGSGNPKKGKIAYMENCGKCHVLHGEGGKIGPDLTSFKRDNEERILQNVINPSLEIREGFENFVVTTFDGRTVNGFLADQDNQVVVLRGIDGQNLIIRRDEIDEMQAIKRSVMPEGTLKNLTPQQIRDLFAYLRASQPVNY
jgi:putative heme-binding domain-containing protein